MNISEKGFTYPLTLCVLIIFLMFFSMHIDQLQSARKLANEQLTLLQEEYYFLASVKKTEELYQTNGALPAAGVFTYEKAAISYKSETPSSSIQKVNFTLSLNSGPTVIGIGYFDTRSKKLAKWVEAN